MNLGNQSETIVHYLLIGGMARLTHWNEFLIVSALVRIVIIELDLLMSYDIGYLISRLH